MSITIARPKAHVPAPYDDHFGDDGLFRYHHFGLQGMHHRDFTVPRHRDQRPDPEFLERRYEPFKAAG